MDGVSAAASILQVAAYGLATAEQLYKFAKSVSGARKRIERLASHVQSNSRVLDRLRGLLEDDKDAQLNQDIRNDIEIAASSCEKVFRDIDKVLTSTVKAHALPGWQRAKFALFDEPQVKGFRAELSECQVSLSLILLIHWRPGRDLSAATQSSLEDQVKCAVVDVLRGGFEQARQSSVPSIASAVEEFASKIAGLSIVEKRDGRGSGPSNDSATALGGTKPTAANPFIDFAVPNIPHRPNEQPPPVTRGWSLDSGSVPDPTTAEPTHAATGFRQVTTGVNTSGQTMWAVRPGPPDMGYWSAANFMRVRLPQSHIDAFIIDRATKLLDELGSLDDEIYEAISAHALKLQHDLVALTVHHHDRLATGSTRFVRSLDLVTQDSQPSIHPAKKADIITDASVQAPVRNETYVPDMEHATADKSAYRAPISRSRGGRGRFVNQNTAREQSTILSEAIYPTDASAENSHRINPDSEILPSLKKKKGLALLTGSDISVSRPTGEGSLERKFQSSGNIAGGAIIQGCGPPNLKISRAVAACLECRQRQVRCGGEQPACRRCIDSGRDCSFTPINNPTGPLQPSQLESTDHGSAFATVETLEFNSTSRDDYLFDHFSVDIKTSNIVNPGMAVTVPKARKRRPGIQCLHADSQGREQYMKLDDNHPLNNNSDMQTSVPDIVPVFNDEEYEQEGKEGEDDNDDKFVAAAIATSIRFWDQCEDIDRPERLDTSKETACSGYNENARQEDAQEIDLASDTSNNDDTANARTSLAGLVTAAPKEVDLEKLASSLIARLSERWNSPGATDATDEAANDNTIATAAASSPTMA